MTLDFAMLACSVVMEGLLLGILMRRGIGRRLPWFCVYIAWSLVSDVAGWVALGISSTFYMRFYLCETLIECVLQFAVLLELAWSMLRSIHATLDKRNVWLVGAALFLAGMMLWPWASAEVPRQLTGPLPLLMHLELTVSLLRILCMVAIVAASRAFAIGWRDGELQVAAGLAFYSICSFIVTVIHSHASTYSPLLDRTRTAIYLGVLGYWIVQFVREPARRAAL